MNGDTGSSYTYSTSAYTANQSYGDLLTDNAAAAANQHRGVYLPQQPLIMPQQQVHIGPSSMQYNPTANNFSHNDSGSVQQLQNQHHQLILASVAANFAHHHQQQQQQHHDLAASAAAASAFLSQAAQQAASFEAISSSNANINDHQHLRQNSYDQMLLMHPSLLAPLELDDFPSNAAIENHHHASPVAAQEFSSRLISNTVLEESWLMEIHVPVPSISLEPLSGNDILRRISLKLEDVLTKYIPCVDFLVQCQQDLRRGLEDATKPSYRRRRLVTPREFYAQHIERLPEQFYAKNRFQMDATSFQKSYEGLQQLRRDAEQSSHASSSNGACETVKSTFLGGMKDGESWGLRKWLSQHGDALSVCTDLECILGAVQKLDKNLTTTKLLSDQLRPMAMLVLQRLKTDIPTSYQQHSSAHPYLPFFHRLEAALRSMSQFDPTDDGIICLDDDSDDDDEVKEVAVAEERPTSNSKRKRPPLCLAADEDAKVRHRSGLKKRAPPTQHKARVDDSEENDDSSSGESEAQSVVEVIDAKTAVLNNCSSAASAADDDGEIRLDWKCTYCTMENAGTRTTCYECGEANNTMIMKDLIPELEFFLTTSTNSSRSRTSNSSGASISSGIFGHVETRASPPPTKKIAAKTKSRTRPPPKKQNYEAPALASYAMCPIPVDQPEEKTAQAHAIADNLDQLASMFDSEQQGAVRPLNAPFIAFWDGPIYARALRLVADVLRRPESSHYLDAVLEDELARVSRTPYSYVIRHPLCFRDVCGALLGENLVVSAGNNGKLPTAANLQNWNMWKGTDLLMAVDLILINSLAYEKVALGQQHVKSPFRTWINSTRKLLWHGITEIVQPQACTPETKRQCMPIRRSATSGFVVHKIATEALAAASLED